MVLGVVLIKARRLRREWLICLALVLAIAALMQRSGVLASVDVALYDHLLKVDSLPAHPDILIIAIDETSLRAIGRWPWPREVHTQLLRRLASAKPRAVALDILFTEPADQETDDQLALALSGLRAVAPVFLPVTARTPLVRGQVPEPLRPLPALEQAVTGLGHIHIELDDDSVVRSLYLREGTKQHLWPALSSRLAQVSGASFAGGSANAPEDGTGWQRESRVLLPFSGPPGHYRSVPYVSVLRGEVPEAALRGKTVLIGLTATGIGDHYPTPFSSGVGLTPGVEINAAAVDGLMRHRLIVPANSQLQAVAALLALVGWMACLWRLGPRAGLLGLVVFGVLAVATSAALQVGFRIWLPVAVWLLPALIGYLLWSWRRLAVLMADLYLRADAMPKNDTQQVAVPHADGWHSVVEALDRGLQAEQHVQRQRTEALQLLSHDLRAPQSAILALLRTQRVPDAEGALLHERIERQVRTTLALADDFVMQLRADTDVYAWEDVDLAQLMTEVYERAWPLAREKRINLVLTLPETHADLQDDERINESAETNCWMYMEPRLLARALFNLVDNAIKYSSPDSAVDLALIWSLTGPAVVTVSDHGAGIAPADLPRLFERYSRFHRSGNAQAANTESPTGYGLGLSLVETVVRRHGGKVDCDSEIGQGTVFTVVLPRENPANIKHRQ